jgi:hypothetical protein
MDKQFRTWTDDYFGNGNGRKASLFVSHKGYEVEFYKDDELVEVRRLYENNRDYAQDTCENWVQEVIQ